MYGLGSVVCCGAKTQSLLRLFRTQEANGLAQLRAVATPMAGVEQSAPSSAPSTAPNVVTSGFDHAVRRTSGSQVRMRWLVGLGECTWSSLGLHASHSAKQSFTRHKAGLRGSAMIFQPANTISGLREQLAAVRAREPK